MTYVRDNQIFFNVHEVVNADSSKLRELLPALLEEGSNLIPFLTLASQRNYATHDSR